MGKLVVTYAPLYHESDTGLPHATADVVTEVIDGDDSGGTPAATTGSTTCPFRDGVASLTAHGSDVWAKIEEAPTAAQGEGFLVKQNETIRVMCTYGHVAAVIDDSTL